MARNAAGSTASHEATTRQIAGGAQLAATAVSVDIYDQVYHLRGTDPRGGRAREYGGFAARGSVGLAEYCR